MAGAAVLACVLVLVADYAVATWRAPRDEKLVKALQQQVKSDAALAPKLAAEQKRITAARAGRKSRDRFTAWALIAAAAVFLTYAKRVVRSRPAAPPPQKAARAASAEGKRRSSAPPPAPETVAIDLAFVDQTAAKFGAAKEAAIPILQAIQEHYRYLPDEALRRVCEITRITPAQIAGTSSFYGQFRRSPAGKHTVKVCHGTACHVAGARHITDELRRYLAIPECADTDAERLFTVEEVACLGCCSLAPVLMVDGETAGRLTAATAPAALKPFERTETA